MNSTLFSKLAYVLKKKQQKTHFVDLIIGTVIMIKCNGHSWVIIILVVMFLYESNFEVHCLTRASSLGAMRFST